MYNKGSVRQEPTIMEWKSKVMKTHPPVRISYIYTIKVYPHPTKTSESIPPYSGVVPGMCGENLEMGTQYRTQMEAGGHYPGLLSQVISISEGYIYSTYNTSLPILNFLTR